MSLRTRLILSHTFIVVLCLSIAAVVAAVLLQGYRDRAIMARLDDMTRPIYVQVRALAMGQASLAEVWDNLREQAQRNGVFIFLVDGEGNVLRQATPQESPRQQPIPVAPGALPHGISQPTRGTFTTALGETFVFAAYPFGPAQEFQAPARAESLVLATPRSGALVIWASLIRPFFWAAVIALGVSVATAILVARSVYRPVQRLVKAAENVAEGQYDQEMPISGPREIKGLAVSFREMAKRVKESQHQLRHFVADVSHQLKSPLTSIQGFAQAMLDGTAEDSEARSKATQIIVDESKRMIRQVNELLELSRMQMGQVKMARELVDVKELLVHCQEIFALRADEKGILLKTSVEPLMPVIGDADRLEDVFCNLLDNAIKNTPGEGEVQISARNSEDNRVEVIVADSGPGIPPEQLPYVFQRFHQVGGLRSGFGLGLAIAKEIVLAHGGKLEVSSSPGEGAKFTVTLPSRASSS